LREMVNKFKIRSGVKSGVSAFKSAAPVSLAPKAKVPPAAPKKHLSAPQAVPKADLPPSLTWDAPLDSISTKDSAPLMENIGKKESVTPKKVDIKPVTKASAAPKPVPRPAAMVTKSETVLADKPHKVDMPLDLLSEQLGATSELDGDYKVPDAPKRVPVPDVRPMPQFADKLNAEPIKSSGLQRDVIDPEAAKVYNRTDFGKY